MGANTYNKNGLVWEGVVLGLVMGNIGERE